MKDITKLQNSINKSMKLSSIIDKFCEYFKDENKFVFETGLYEFTCDEEYLFSLCCDDIRLDIIYPPSSKIYELSSKIEFDSTQKFKELVLKSNEFTILQNEPIYKLSIRKI